MTETTKTASPDDAVTSVVGYLKRSWERLAADHVTGGMTPASLRQLAAGLIIIGRRLHDAAGAIESGKSQVPISDTIDPGWPPPPEFCPHCGAEQRADSWHDEGTCIGDEAKALAWYRAIYDDPEADDDLVLARLAAWFRRQSLGPEIHGVPRREGVAWTEPPFWNRPKETA
jgi:hypothetical protein